MVIGCVNVVARLIWQEVIGVHTCRVVAEWNLQICNVLM